MDPKSNNGTVVQLVHPPGTEIVEQPGQKNVINYNPVFPTLMGQIELTDIDTQALADDLIKAAGGRENYEGGWTTYFTQDNLAHIREFDKVAQAAVGVAVSYAKEMKWQVQPEDARLYIWANVMTKKGLHPIHRHPLASVSGTFYVKCNEKSAAIQFFSPMASLRMHEPRPAPQDQGPFTSDTLTILPRPSTMLVWPAWLEHCVNQHLDDEPRVSISFNVDFVRKQ